MKTIKLKHLLMLLCICLGGGCDNEGDEYEEIPLSYTKCPCDRKMEFIKEVSMEDVLLFDERKTSFSEMKELSSDGERSEFVCYSSESDSTVFYSFSRTIHTGYICNFPEAAKEWEIPYNGIYISYSADEFEACHGGPSPGFIHTFSDIVLISLKKRKK